jgi:hypothetical protein
MDEGSKPDPLADLNRHFRRKVLAEVRAKKVKRKDGGKQTRRRKAEAAG